MHSLPKLVIRYAARFSVFPSKSSEAPSLRNFYFSLKYSQTVKLQIESEVNEAWILPFFFILQEKKAKIIATMLRSFWPRASRETSMSSTISPSWKATALVGDVSATLSKSFVPIRIPGATGKPFQRPNWWRNKMNSYPTAVWPSFVTSKYSTLIEPHKAKRGPNWTFRPSQNSLSN